MLDRWQERALLLGVSTLALGLRHAGYGERDPWVDEVQTRMFAEGSWRYPIEVALSGPPLTLPPLYFWLVKGARWVALAGDHGRLPSVLAGAASVPLLYYVGRTLVSREAALVASCLLALSPLHIRYSREARPYAVLICAALLLILLFAQGGLVTGKARVAKVAVLCVVLAWLHYIGLVFAIAGLGVLIVKSGRGSRWIAAVALIACLPVGVLLIAGLGGHSSATTGVAVTAAQITTFVGWLGAVGHSVLDPRVWFLPALAACGLVVAPRAVKFLPLVLVVATIPAIAVALLPSYALYARYGVHLIPVLCLLAACAVDAAPLRGVPRFGLMASTVLVWAMLTASPVAQYFGEQATPYASFGRLFVAKANRGDAVMFVIESSHDSIAYYGPQIEETLSAVVGAGVPVFAVGVDDFASRGDERTWIVRWVPHGYVPLSPEFVLQSRDSLDDIERLVLGSGSLMHLAVKPPRPI